MMNEGSGSNSKKRQVSLEEIPMAHASSNTNSSVAMLNSPVDSLDDKKSNRGNYRCSRCNLPKKGHKCPYQPVFRKREYGLVETVDNDVQVCMDEDMTLAMLGDLSRQGLPESYILSNTIPNNPGIENAHAYPVAAVDNGSVFSENSL